jgi:hypothetical protein
LSLLLEAIARPATAATLSPQAWNRLAQEIRGLRLDARISFLLEARGLAGSCPLEPWEDLCAQRCHAAFLQAQMRFELRKIAKALASADTPILLLKGAAYMMADLSVAQGRPFTDLDILVPRERLAAAEAALLAAGWQHQKTDDYDQQYYRRFMHELPPMHHRDRGIIVDVHHSILPLTSRLQPDPARLWADSVSLPQSSLRVLSPVDMVLHSAAHLFYDGEISGGFGNLLDLHLLISDFGRDPTFHGRLLDRAEQLQLGRPLYYALLFCRRLCGTPVPDGVVEASRRFAPGPVTRWLMKTLVPPVLGPRYPRHRPAAFSAWLLYLRSHWLRMPPAQLAGHLSRKGLRRLQAQP